MLHAIVNKKNENNNSLTQLYLFCFLFVFLAYHNHHSIQNSASPVRGHGSYPPSCLCLKHLLWLSLRVPGTLFSKISVGGSPSLLQYQNNYLLYVNIIIRNMQMQAGISGCFLYSCMSISVHKLINTYGIQSGWICSIVPFPLCISLSFSENNDQPIY